MSFDVGIHVGIGRCQLLVDIGKKAGKAVCFFSSENARPRHSIACEYSMGQPMAFERCWHEIWLKIGALFRPTFNEWPLHINVTLLPGADRWVGKCAAEILTCLIFFSAIGNIMCLGLARSSSKGVVPQALNFYPLPVSPLRSWASLQGAEEQTEVPDGP